MNEKTKIFEAQLTNIINNSGLPANILFYIIRNAELQVLQIYNDDYMREMREKAIQEQQQQQQEQMQMNTNDEQEEIEELVEEGGQE